MQEITVTYIGPEGDDFYRSDRWEIQGGLLTIWYERVTAVMPLTSVRCIRFEEA